jgi:hypothetical protein
MSTEQVESVELFDEVSGSKKSSLGDTERLPPDEARDFIKDLSHIMRRRALDMAQNEELDNFEYQEDGTSAQKHVYGERWTMIYGICVGMNKMLSEKETELKGQCRVTRGISGDGSWQEHYDEWGYGTYGRGLEIGKQLAFFEDRAFTISDNPDTGTDEEESNESPDFTIRSYDNEE